MQFVRNLKGFSKLTYTEKRLILLERYLSTYHEFELDDKPIWSMLGMTSTEDYRSENRMSLRVEQYLANEIKESYGYTLEEFLNLPTYFMEDLLTRQRTMLSERRAMAKKQKEDAERDNNRESYNLSANLHRFNAY